MSAEGTVRAPSLAADAVLVRSSALPDDMPAVRGYDFNGGVDFEKMMESFACMGFQGTSLAKAVDEVNRMIRWRLADDPPKEDDDAEVLDPEYRRHVRCKIFFAYTSNLISSGLREAFRYLLQHRMVDVVVTTAGGVEEDFIKCLAPTYVGAFHLPGKALREKGINRIGNLLVPNSNYCAFEDWVTPILDAMLKEQKEHGVTWTPSKMIHRLGKEINHPDSVYYWAYKNNIPVFCPAITDGSLGDMIYFHSYRNPGLIIDVAGDIRAINDHALGAKKTGMIILGGGVVKHHTCNANLMRNGADFAVYINTGQEYDGSDAGASPDEAVSWGKIRVDANPVKLHADATLVFPFIVASTFAKHWEPREEAGGAAPGAEAEDRR